MEWKWNGNGMEMEWKWKWIGMDWFNLLIGFYNLYLYANGSWWFNLIVGSLNIGVWVFNRNIAFKLWEKDK